MHCYENKNQDQSHEAGKGAHENLHERNEQEACNHAVCELARRFGGIRVAIIPAGPNLVKAEETERH
jgi:hypothetical protein